VVFLIKKGKFLLAVKQTDVYLKQLRKQYREKIE